MKESKKYFENNRLNKGYSKISNYKQNDLNQIRHQFKHVLPPVDIMEEYEEMCPGTFAKLLDMAECEQNHRHSVELVIQEKYNRATTLGRYFSLILVSVISLSTLILALFGEQIVASIFASSAFACIYMISRLYANSAIKKIVDLNRKNNFQYTSRRK